MSGGELRWGQTPWDDMPREELLRHVQRLYSACLSARGVLHMVARNDPLLSPFWDKGGTGGDTLAKCEHAMREAAPAFFDAEGDLYDRFYRYAVDLLFPGLGFGWMVCECGRTWGEDPTGKRATTCLWPGCGKPLRPLTWDDLKPEAGK